MIEIVGGVATATALALSVYNFVVQVRSNRSASLSARLEFRRAPKENWLDGLSFERLVVTNHGPAGAADVRLRFDDGVDVSHDPQALGVEQLHPAQEHHVNLLGSIDRAPPAWVQLEWTDGRRGRQERKVWLSPQQLR